MNSNLFNPFAWWLFPIAVFAVVLQAAICYDQGEVSRERLGSLGKRGGAF